MERRDIHKQEREAYIALRTAHKLLLEMNLLHLADSLNYPLISLERRLDM